MSRKGALLGLAHVTERIRHTDRGRPTRARVRAHALSCARVLGIRSVRATRRVLPGSRRRGPRASRRRRRRAGRARARRCGGNGAPAARAGASPGCVAAAEHDVAEEGAALEALGRLPAGGGRGLSVTVLLGAVELGVRGLVVLGAGRALQQLDARERARLHRVRRRRAARAVGRVGAPLRSVWRCGPERLGTGESSTASVSRESERERARRRARRRQRGQSARARARSRGPRATRARARLESRCAA